MSAGLCFFVGWFTASRRPACPTDWTRRREIDVAGRPAKKLQGRRRGGFARPAGARRDGQFFGTRKRMEEPFASGTSFETSDAESRVSVTVFESGAFERGLHAPCLLWFSSPCPHGMAGRRARMQRTNAGTRIAHPATGSCRVRRVVIDSAVCEVLPGRLSTARSRR